MTRSDYLLLPVASMTLAFVLAHWARGLLTIASGVIHTLPIYH